MRSFEQRRFHGGAVGLALIALAIDAPAQMPTQVCRRPLLTGDGAQLYVETTGVGPIGSSIALFGNAAIRVDLARIRALHAGEQPDDSFTSPIAGALIGRDWLATAIPLPTAPLRMWSPVVVPRSDSSIDVVWAERLGDSGPLFHAILSSHGWSPVDTFNFGGKVFWIGAPGPAFRDHGGRLTIIAPHVTEHGVGIVVIRQSERAWSISHVELDRLPAYVAAAGGPDAVALLYVASDRRSPEPDRNSVFSARLIGDSLVDVRLVKHSGAGAAWEPRILRVGQTLHALWLDQAPTESTSSRLAHATTSDGGRQWTMAAPLETGAIDRFDASVSADESFAVVVRDAAGTHALRTATWNSSWSTPGTTALTTRGSTKFVPRDAGHPSWPSIRPVTNADVT